MKFAVVRFPGSNCDEDAYHAVAAIIHQPVEFIWHQSEDLSGCDVVILPGGFAYGDYLRTGAIARFSPVMKSVDRFARSGGLVLGICNGFQILLEAGLLPGAMMRNKGLRYLCRHVHIRVESTDTPFTCAAQKGQVLKIPIAHNEGNYFCEPAALAELERNGQIIFHYVKPDGTDAAETTAKRIPMARPPPGRPPPPGPARPSPACGATGRPPPVMRGRAARIGAHECEATRDDLVGGGRLGIGHQGAIVRVERGQVKCPGRSRSLDSSR